MPKTGRTVDELTIWDDAKEMLLKAKAEGIETAWDRLEQQTPHCSVILLDDNKVPWNCWSDTGLPVAGPRLLVQHSICA